MLHHVTLRVYVRCHSGHCYCELTNGEKYYPVGIFHRHCKPFLLCNVVRVRFLNNFFIKYSMIMMVFYKSKSPSSLDLFTMFSICIHIKKNVFPGFCLICFLLYEFHIMKCCCCSIAS